MQSRIVFVPETTAADRAGPLELAVLYTNPALTAATLEAALQLARGCAAGVTIVAVHVLPYPAPLAVQEGIREHLEAELSGIARTCPVAIRLKLVFARNRAEVYRQLLERGALVVMGTRRRWWPTREERLARRLAAGGRSVALVKVS